MNGSERRLSHVALVSVSNVDKKSSEGDPEVLLCNYVDVYKNENIIASLDFMHATATEDQAKTFELKAGDTIFTKDSETATDIGVPGYLPEDIPHLVCGYHLAIARPKTTEITPKYLFWCLNSNEAFQQWAVLAAGVTRVGLRQADIGKLRLWVPLALADQQEVSDLLDRETAQIDALLAKQERLIEVLNERRWALIDTVAWRGLTPTSHTEVTGVEPAPASPSHWRRLRNKDLFRERVELSESGDEELLSVSHLTGVSPRSEKRVNMFEAQSLEGYKVVHPDDLVINTLWAWMGALGMSNHYGIASPAYGVYRLLNPTETDPRYFNYLYTSRPYVCEMTRHSKGVWSSRLRLYPETFLRLRTVVPPIQEQHAIADYLDRTTAKIDALIDKAKHMNVVLRERRSALISAAVTGKIDVSKRTVGAA